MNWREKTWVFMALLIAAAAAYDVLALVNGGVDATISRVVLWAFAHSLLVPFLFGGLTGHLFWRRGQGDPAASVLVFGCALGLFGLAHTPVPGGLLFGVLAGHHLCPQDPGGHSGRPRLA